MFCGKCGVPLPENAKFCNKCGTPVMKQSIQSEKSNADQFIDCNRMGEYSNSDMGHGGRIKWPIIAGIAAAVIILFIIIGGSSFDPVETVKQGYLTQFSSTVNIGDALDNRFKDGKWSYDESTISDGAYNVYFDGYDPLTEKDWRISFLLEDAGDDGSWVSVDAISTDGDVEYDDTIIYYLMSYIYTGNLNELFTDIGTALGAALFSLY